MAGAFFSVEPSLYFVLLVGCGIFFVVSVTLTLCKKAGFWLVSLASLLMALEYLASFLLFGFQENPAVMRLTEQFSVFLLYCFALAVYGILRRFQSSFIPSGILDTHWFRAVYFFAALVIVFFTPLAVSDRLSYLKGPGGGTYYVTDYALFSPLNLLLPFLLVLAGIVKGLRVKGKWRIINVLSLVLLSVFFVLEALFIFGIWNLPFLRRGLSFGLMLVWMVTLAEALKGGVRRYGKDNERKIGSWSDSLRGQEPTVNDTLERIARGIGEVLGASEDLKKILSDHDSVFSGLFVLLKESSENRQKQTETYKKRGAVITALQNEVTNRSLLVPLLLDRWQGFYNEVKGITGNSSDIAQSIDRLISSTDSGKILIQDHLKATNNIRQSADKVRFIVGLINDVSEQTNILSINAAIEAYRAGEHGRGFSIIAEEIRQVAATTLEESNAISECIGRILENSRAEEILVKENDAIYNDFSKTMERLFVYILNVIEVAKELRQKMETLLHDIKELESGLGVTLQQEQIRQSNLISETGRINQFIEDGDRMSEELFQISSFFAEMEGMKRKNAEYLGMLEETRVNLKNVLRKKDA